MAWAQNACTAFAVGQNKGYGWAGNTDRQKAQTAAMDYCRQYDSGCQVLAAVCSQDQG